MHDPDTGILDSAPSPPTDGCGCATPAAPAPAEDPAPPADPAPSVRRGLKLVVAILGDGPAGQRVLLAVGAEGCDPELRTLEVADLFAALDEVPALVANAETRWRAEPRYPASRRPARPTSAAPRPAPQPTPPQAETSDAQLTLFANP